MSKMDLDIINLGGIEYISGTTIVASTTRSPFFGHPKLAGHVPVIVLNAVGQCPTEHWWLERRIMELESKDDVINTIFTKRVIVKVSGVEVEDIQDQCTPSDVYIEHADITREFYSTSLRDGPYFLDGCNLYKAYRLYDDPYGAFVSGVKQRDEEPFIFKEMLRIKSKVVIPVPSRHYFPPPSEQKPLSGKRIAVKDIYDLWGLPTAAGCPQYAEHRGFAFDTAECIKTLLDAGAVIVAKAKTVQFASGMASADWGADTCPTNPRGDGQLDTDCSSSGSAAAIAGYEWLDFAVGSDSLGSMTGPAAACGVFGLRPSFGALSNVGAVPVSAVLDTPGHFSRSISELSFTAKAWLKPIDKATSSVPAVLSEKWIVARILTPSEWEPFHIPSKDSAMKEFVQDLEAYWKVAHTPFSIDKCWNHDPERPAGETSLNDYLQRTVADIQLHDCWENISKFFEEYSEERQGRLNVDELITYKWDIGRSVTDSDYETSVERKEIFKKFLERSVFREGTIMVLPGGSPDIRFRDERTPVDQYNKWQGFGFQNTTYSVLGGLPAISVPVGQRQYRSKTTGETVNQPVSVTVLGPRNSDLWLMHHLENALRKDKRSVLVGSDTFEVSEPEEKTPRIKGSLAHLKL